MLQKHFTKLLALLTGVFAAVRHFSYRSIADSIVTRVPVLDSDTYFRWGYELSTTGQHPSGPFWLGPGYPQFIGWLFSLTGDVSPQVILVAQMLLSCATFLLLLLVTRKLFGERASLFAGILGILYAPWLYFDGMILSASWILFLNSAMFFFLIEYGGATEDEPRNWWAWAIAGGLCALSALARPSILPFAAMLTVFLAWRVWQSKLKPSYLVAFVLALILVHLPTSLRNSREGGSPVFVTASGGVNFFIGNREGASGIYDELDFIQTFDAPAEAEGYRLEASKRVGRNLTLPEAANVWKEYALRDVFADKFGWLGVELKKLWWTLRNEEVANNFSFRATQMINPVVDHLPIRWGVLLPLAVAGLVMFWDRRKKLLLYLFYSLSYVATILIFFSSSEYRFPLVLVFLPLAGYAIHAIIEGFRNKQTTRVAVALVVYVVLLLPANAPSKTAYDQVYPRSDFANVGTTAMRYDMFSEAMGMFARALAIDPDYRPARLGLADALWRTRNFDQAREEYERLGVSPPDSLSGAPLETLKSVIDSIRATEGDSAALAELDRAIPHPESLAVRDLWVERAKLQAADNRYGAAYWSMLNAHDLDPTSPDWLFWAAEYVLQMDFAKQADSLYQAAIDLYPAYAPARIEKGFLALEVGDLEEAVRQSRELDKIHIPNDSIRAQAEKLDSLLQHLYE